MLRVRPGVELVLAIFDPSRQLITLDLPTFERPRNATSGSTGAGKGSASIADNMNRAKTRMTQCAVRPTKLASRSNLRLTAETACSKSKPAADTMTQSAIQKFSPASPAAAYKSAARQTARAQSKMEPHGLELPAQRVSP